MHAHDTRRLPRDQQVVRLSELFLQNPNGIVTAGNRFQTSWAYWATSCHGLKMSSRLMLRVLLDRLPLRKNDVGRVRTTVDDLALTLGLKKLAVHRTLNELRDAELILTQSRNGQSGLDVELPGMLHRDWWFPADAAWGHFERVGLTFTGSTWTRTPTVQERASWEVYREALSLIPLLAPTPSDTGDAVPMRVPDFIERVRQRTIEVILATGVNEYGEISSFEDDWKLAQIAERIRNPLGK